MDPFVNRRPVIQKQSQTAKTTFGSSVPVPKANSARPRNFDFINTPSAVHRPRPSYVPRRPQSDVRPAASVPDQTRIDVPAQPVQPQPLQGKPAQATTISARPFPNRLGVTATQYAARQVPMDMALPGTESRANEPFKYRAKWRQLRLGVSRGVAMAMVVVIIFGGLVFSQGYLKLHKVFNGGTGTAAALNANVKPEMLKGEGRGRVNILLLGRGGGTHDAPDLTDTLMVASIDPVNHTATLLSLPRDLWVNVADKGVMKLNAAWETGVYNYLGKQSQNTNNSKAIAAGFDSIDKTVEDVLGLNIDYNSIVDFQAFKQAVDTVGGVSINVPSDLVDPTMAWENGRNPVLAKAGPQMFDGKQALIYARSRETSSDFARADRQRALLLALKGKVATMGTLGSPKKMAGLMGAFGNNVHTDLSLNNATRLYRLLRTVNSDKINSISLADAGTSYVSGGNIAGQSVVLPKAGLFKYDEIREFIRNKLRDPYLIKENSRIAILNGTEVAGLAAIKANELKSFGYNVSYLGNTPNPGWTATILVDMTHKGKFTKHYLEDRLGVTASDSLSDSTIKTGGADFVIILGSDALTSTNN
jgi:LCP family protein required for cell wall assembly